MTTRMGLGFEGLEAPAFPRTAQLVVVERLRREILSGAIPPGTRLLQAQVAKWMGTSTTPVREAFRQLSAEHLLDLDPHRGALVHGPTLDELMEVYELRMAIEPGCIASAAMKISDSELETTRGLLSTMEGLSDPVEWLAYNERLHDLLVEASRRSITATILQNLRDLSSLYVRISLESSPHRLEVANREHRELVELCAARESENAAKAILGHLASTVDLVRETFVRGGEQVATTERHGR